MKICTDSTSNGESVKELTDLQGHIFVLDKTSIDEPRPYMLVQVSKNKHRLICLTTGNRYYNDSAFNGYRSQWRDVTDEWCLMKV